MLRLVARTLAVALSVAPLLGGFVSAAEPQASGTVRGVIHDALGGLLVREETSITVALYAGDRVDTPAITADLVSSAYGGFEIPGVPVGRYSVKFVSHHAALAGEWWGDTRRAAERAFIDVPEGGVVDLADVRLDSTVRLAGRITGRNEPSPHQSIHIAATTGDPELDAWLPGRTSDVAVGERYTVSLLPGRFDVSYTDVSGGHFPVSVRALDVGTSGVTKDVALQAARASIAGTILTRTQEGIVPSQTATRLLYRLSSSGDWKQVLPCGFLHESAFFMDCLTAGRYKLALQQDGVISFWGGEDLASATEIVLGQNQTLTGLDVVVDAPVHVSGVVTCPVAGAAKPCYGGRIAIWRQNAAGGWVVVPDAVTTNHASGLTGPDGEFEAFLAPGTYVFRVWTDGATEGATYLNGARFFADARPITLGPGEQRNLGAVPLPVSSFDVKRIAGADRFATAVAVSRRTVPDGMRAPVVYLTNAYTFPDALAAGPAAMRAGGVILPVSRDVLPSAIADELRRLRPQRVVLAGGTSAVSNAVRAAVARAVPDAAVVRLGGASRYDTADLIVRDAFSAKGSQYAIVATGSTYPDALAAGPAAGHLDAPVLLVNGRAVLSASTKATIAKLGITDVYIAGGTSAVGTAVESGLRAVLGKAHVTRLAGSDRVFTAIELNAAIFGSVDYGYVASAAGFADALAGGPLAASQDAPLYLASANCLNPYTIEGLRYRQIARLTLLGGTAVLGPGVAALKTCR